jgi:hypothetical protein
MERLAEQIVDWHNRHPLARRIGVGDVHTIGVVALPFVRTSAEAGGFVEPVLTDAVSAFDALDGSPPASRWTVWSQQLKALPARLSGRAKRTQWRAFSEKFIPGLSPARIEAFALAHGFAEAPATPETRPWRVIVIDEALAAKRGGWPFELYLMSAGVEQGNARTRVLSGRGIPSQIIGRRLWDPRRAGAAAAALAVLVGVAAWSMWPHPAAEPVAPPAAAASAASAPPPAPIVPATAPSAPPAASAPASSPAEPASAAAAASAAGEGGEPAVPDIRPRLVERADGKTLPPLLGGGKPAEKAVEKPAQEPVDKPTDRPAENASEPAAKAAEPPDPRLSRLAESPGTQAVALVGPAGSKADAEALLAKMKAGLVGVHSNPEALQADVIKTPEGWRATIWPFPSREQAQLINATLVARGLKTKAVNF